MSTSMRTALSALLLVLLGSCGMEPEEDREPQRYLWVTRWDYETAQDVESIVENAASAGFDALVFQVRGAASTAYPSELEPPSPEVEAAPEGFDPLRTVIRLAQDHDVEIHAWINCVPSWWGLEPPADPRHVYNAHPEWHWYDQNGDRQQLSERFYVSLNPCLPEVRAHIVAVCEELVTSYALDGLHLDYIRFPNEPPATPRGSGSDWPRDALTLELYREASGLAPDEDRSSWDRWRAEKVTEVVREIRRMVDDRSPGLILSTAVGSEPERALEEHFQDTMRWIDEGLLDLVLPMNYTSDLQLFAERLERWKIQADRVPIAMGVMVKGDPDVRTVELRQASSVFPKLAVFGYHELFDSKNEVLTQQDAVERIRRSQRRLLLLPEIGRGTY
jgi:uncharacterized lipoprotein YddW (UPF0748 family)